VLLDVMLDLIGGALFIGQAIHFLLFTATWAVPGPSENPRIVDCITRASRPRRARDQA
jgi:hypothetical protein